MLNFFRKHQKFFFIVVTVFVVTSFCFFGTFTTLAGGDGEPDRVITKAIDGSSITARELEALNRILSTSYEEPTTAPNLFNDGVIRKEFLSTGMASLLVERNFDLVKEDLEARLKKAKHFRPYVHPKAPFLSAEAVWQQYFPMLSRDLAFIRAETEATPESFFLLSRLYAAQLQMPPDSLKQLLLYQQSHFQNLPPDPDLQRSDLSLFGFHTMEDWFGPHFVDLVSQFILNSAGVAVQRGYRVSYDEARADLLFNVNQVLQAHRINSSEMQAHFQGQLRALQLDETTVVKAWRKVMLFRRLFHDVGNSALVDPLVYQNFGKYAKEGVVVDLYQLPKELRFENTLALLKFQLYLDAVTSKKEQGAMLPTAFLTPDEVEERFPQLVERCFVVEIAEARMDQIASRVSLKETWEWQADQNNWDLLKKEFPLLGECSAQNREERFQFLEKIDAKARLKIDEFSRFQIAGEHPEWLEEALEKAPVRTETLSIRSKAFKPILKGVNDSKKLMEQLQAQEYLSRFSEDGNLYYRMKVLERTPYKQVMTFAAAVRDGTLEALLDKKLEAAYPDVRKKDNTVFQAAEGGWKPYAEVREEVGKRVYADLIEKVKNQPELRLAEYMKVAQSHLAQSPEDPNWIRTDEVDTTRLDRQWLLEKSSAHLTRSAPLAFGKEEIFKLKEGSWSDVATTANGNLYFVRVLEHIEGGIGGEMTQGQEILSIDARRHLMTQVLNEMAAHGL
jgi:GcvH upstream region-like protein